MTEEASPSTRLSHGEAAEAVAEVDSAAVAVVVMVAAVEVTVVVAAATVAAAEAMVAAAVARVEATAAEAVEAETVATEVPIVTPPGVADRRATGGARLPSCLSRSLVLGLGATECGAVRI